MLLFLCRLAASPGRPVGGNCSVGVVDRAAAPRRESCRDTASRAGERLESLAGVLWRWARWLLVVLPLAMAGFAAMAANPEGQQSGNAHAGGSSVASVNIDGRELFRVVGVSSFPASKRANGIADTVRKFASDHARSVDEIAVIDEGDRTAFVFGPDAKFLFFDADAALENVDRKILVQVVDQKIREVVHQYRVERGREYLLSKAGFAAVASVVILLVLWGARKGLRKLAAALETRYRASVRGLRIDTFHIIEEEQLWVLMRSGFLTLWWILALVCAYIYLEQVLSKFPWTRGFAHQLVTLVIDPLETMGKAFLDYIPDLIFLVVLALLARYVLKLTRFFFLGIARGSVKMASFEPEWSMPTYNLLRIGIVAFTLVMAFPYMPGSSSDAFKGISVFLGVLLSIGSSTMIGNIMAGYSLLYRRAFRVGDRVKIGAHVGDIVVVRQQVTHLRTPKNEEIIIPNSMILNTEIVNFSTMAREGRLLLHSSVTIGYDTPWRQVEAMLIEAARRTDGLLKDPEPFVLERSLDDYYVNYEINAFCDNAARTPALYAAMHRNILDVFNEYGVQIMSPNFVAQPEGAVLVPKDQWYAAPAKAPGAP